MFVGMTAADLLLGGVHSLKGKRSLVRPIVAELRRRFEVGVACVAGTSTRCTEVLDAVERFLAERPEVELLSVQRRVIRDTDV